ncbi:MAG: ATP-binding protein [Planctomycetota bacterium]
MALDSLPPLDRERSDTDESLRQERAKTDEEVAKERRSAQDEADSEIESRRNQSDAALERQRSRADAQIRRTDNTAAGSLRDVREKTNRVLAKERGQTDDLRSVERAEADTTLAKERTDQSSVVDRLLERERERTDEKLGCERGETDCIVAAHKTEIEDRKQSEEALRNQHRRKDELLSVVSHDLRNPLNAILMNAALISKHATSDDLGQRMQRWAEATLRTGQRMQRIVSDLHDGAAIETGALSITKQRADAAPLVREALESSLPLAEAKGIALEGVGLSGAIPVNCDPERIAQVLTNLLDNAIKHTPRGGAIEVAARSSADEIRFSVSDTGIGIDARDLDRGFDRGWQAATGHGGGLGLGLYIARGIVLAHQGAIGVESEPGRGTTFWFTLRTAT